MLIWEGDETIEIIQSILICKQISVMPTTGQDLVTWTAAAKNPQCF